MKHCLPLVIILLLAFQTEAKDRYVGGDISMLPEYEAANVRYSDPQGNKISDLVEYLRDEAGYNIARVRLFVNPTGATGVVQDIDYVIPFCKRLKEAGLKVLLDFHYSDYWADPSHQWIPAAWTQLTRLELQQKIYDYTKEVLTQMVEHGAIPDLIQTGNEISYGMLWGAEGKATYKCYPGQDANWSGFITLLEQAGKACREVCPQAKIIIHTERSGNWGATKDIYRRLANLDYDIIGLSYYPEWHNSLKILSNTLDSINSNFSDKPVMIVETGYYNNWYPSSATYNFTSTWPASAAGQKAFLDDLAAVVKEREFVEGVLYWFPEENPYNNHVYEPWYNHGLFNPSNGRATDGLFSLKILRDFSGEGIVNIENSSFVPSPGATIFTIDGRPLPYTPDLPEGIYICNNRKIAITGK